MIDISGQLSVCLINPGREIICSVIWSSEVKGCGIYPRKHNYWKEEGRRERGREEEREGGMEKRGKGKIEQEVLNISCANFLYFSHFTEY